MKIVQVHTFYPTYLDHYYASHLDTLQLDYAAQVEGLLSDGFSACHMLAPYLREFGYQAELIVANNAHLQQRWMQEQGLLLRSRTGDMQEIVKRQIETIKPDVLYLTDPISFDSRFVRELNWRPRLVLGWRAAVIPLQTDWSEFDLILSNSSICREHALRVGAKAVRHFQPGFPGGFAERTQDLPKRWDVVFSGQAGSEHLKRRQLLTAVAKAPVANRGEFSIGYYLMTSEASDLPAGLAMHNYGARWGMGMYEALRSGRIILNSHIDLAGGEAGNMRLFEATGVGSFLLTEEHPQLSLYFESGSEVATYRSEGELFDKIYYYLEHAEEREAIAKRGQQRCLTEHSMERRAAEFDATIQELLAQSTRPAASPRPAEAPAQTSADLGAARGARDAGRERENTRRVRDHAEDGSGVQQLERALACLNGGKNEDALALLATMSPAAATAVDYGQAVALARLGRRGEAMTVLQRLCLTLPRHRKAARLLAQLEADGVLPELETTLAAATYEEDELVSLISRSTAALAGNRLQEAFQLVNSAKALKRPHRGLDILRAHCFLAMGQAAGALEALREELRYFPDNLEAKQLLDELAPSTTAERFGDREFADLLQIVRPYTMLSEERLFSLFTLVKRVCQENLPGNIVECGVAGGGSSALMAAVIQRYSTQPRFVYSVDSFEGMPQPTEADTHQGIEAEATGWGTGTCAAPESSLLEIAAKLGVTDLVKPIKGYFEEVLPIRRDWFGMIAFLHMDGDWYSSTKAILDYLYEHVSDDGMIQVDDYGYWEGCRKALHDFETARGLHFDLNVIDGTGVWFVKPDHFPVNPEIPRELIQEFYNDAKIASPVTSQMCLNERFQLYFMLRRHLPLVNSPLRFVEIGSFAGYSLLLSYLALSHSGLPVEGYSVEPGDHPQFGYVLNALASRVTRLKAFSHPAASLLKEHFEQDGNFPEFILVDGDHSYEGVYQDILDYYPLLAPGGIILFHDFLPALDEENRDAIYFHHGNKEPGIRRACLELMEQTFQAELLELPLLNPTNPAQTQAHLPIIPGVYSSIRAYRKPLDV
jgi:predicted O-methyltransferase YrrM/predicted Zn-dependent protease